MRTIEESGSRCLPAAFAFDALPMPVPQSVPDRCLAASWHFSSAPALQNDEGSSECFAFGALSSGLSARCLRFAGRLTTTPRKTRLQPVANPCCTGLVTRRAPNEVSAVTWHPPHPSFAWHNMYTNQLMATLELTTESASPETRKQCARKRCARQTGEHDVSLRTRRRSSMRAALRATAVSPRLCAARLFDGRPALLFFRA